MAFLLRMHQKAVVQNNTFLPASLTSANFDGGSDTIPLTATLSCGTKCNDATTRPGSLNASVTFTFCLSVRSAHMYQLFRLLQRTLLVSGLLIAAVQHVYAADGGISLSRTRIIFYLCG
ncbi:hypothetical protein LNQ03_22575 [Klebsiella pneumoniae subsp. pneumoniae]|nr:hypothetical protein [Klebsiella pneumoniae subsp. pneumoniae]